MKRATRFIVYIIPTPCISIHALVKRATLSLWCRLSSVYYFNPRPREEGDVDWEKETKKLYISIHALVKRATNLDFGLGLPCGISIHALVKRATCHSRGEIYYRFISIHALVKRATGLRGAFFINGDISIHALVKRATV